MTSEDLQLYNYIAKPFIDAIITTLLKPKLDSLSSWLKKGALASKVEDNYYESKFQEYLKHTYKNASIINTLVFPNQNIGIRSVYYPLTITNHDAGFKTIDETLNLSLLEKYPRILISDTAGMGKSTLMKWITLKLIETSSSIPILIELRKLNHKNSLLDEVYNQIDPIDRSFDKDLLLKLIEQGLFTIIFDGFDEVEDEYRQHITTELLSFIKKVPKNKFILTSRPESALSAFGEFQLFHIVPLRPKDAFDIIIKYDVISSIKLADSLIDEATKKIDQVQDFLSNPFLVSLLYKAYSYNKDIPLKKSTFYEEVYTALYKHHDLSKDGYKRNKKSFLDIYDFRTVLRHLAIDTAKLGKTSYTEPEILNHLSQIASKLASLRFKAVDFLDDLLITVPLFVRDGNQVKWAHKSIQDYFAAEFIAVHQHREQILEKIFTLEKDSYFNVIDILYDLDTKLINKVIIYSLVKRIVSHFETAYSSSTFDSYATTDLRKSATFGNTFYIFNPNNPLNFENAVEFVKRECNLPEQFSFDSYSKTAKFPDILMKTSYSRHLLLLLYNREVDIFKEAEIVNAGKRKSRGISMKKDFVIVVDDKEDNPFNSPDIFDEITYLINPIADVMEESAIDYKKCLTLISRIEKDIQLEKTDDFLNGF